MRITTMINQDKVLMYYKILRTKIIMKFGELVIKISIFRLGFFGLQTLKICDIHHLTSRPHFFLVFSLKCCKGLVISRCDFYCNWFTRAQAMEKCDRCGFLNQQLKIYPNRVIRGKIHCKIAQNRAKFRFRAKGHAFSDYRPSFL